VNIKIKLNGKENSYYHRILEKLLHSLVPGIISRNSNFMASSNSIELNQFDLLGKKMDYRAL